MRNARMVISFTLTLAAMTTQGFADVKKELEANYQKGTLALVNKDADSAAKLLAPDFTAGQVGGKVITRETFVAALRQQVAHLKQLKRSHRILSVSTKGSLATASVEEVTTAKLELPDGKVHDIYVDETKQDVWVKSGPGWLLKSTRSGKPIMKVDGKLYGAAK